MSVHDSIFHLALPVAFLLLAVFGHGKYEREKDCLHAKDHVWIPVVLFGAWLGATVPDVIYGQVVEPIKLVSLLLWTAGFGVVAGRWRQLGVRLMDEERERARL